jgi:hypothetical protein
VSLPQASNYLSVEWYAPFGSRQHSQKYAGREQEAYLGNLIPAYKGVVSPIDRLVDIGFDGIDVRYDDVP